MTYVIQRTDQGGGYLAVPNSSGHVWTSRLQDAQTFPTEEAARRECCPLNEVPVAVDSIFRRSR